MNREKFLIYQTTHPQIQCRNCKRLLSIEDFSYYKIHDDNTGICRSCDWIKRNINKMAYKNYSYDTLETIVRYIFEFKNGKCIINNLQEILNLTLSEIIEILQHLKIGNKPYSVKVNCECCKQDVLIAPSIYLKNDYIYCSSKCYWEDKPTKVSKGENNAQYNRIHTYCTNCGKDIKVIPSHYNTLNRFDENHNFCCLECYWEYRSKYYINEKSNGKFVKWTDELKNKMRKNLLEKMSNDDRLNTKPQIEINNILDKLKISYTREYNCKYYAIDNYLNDYGLMIEVMGNYWHANPIRFNEEKYLLNEKQLDGIHRDKLKQSYILNHYNVNILYLWEDDILKRKQLCEELILKYINSNGVLDNYHSFNYEIIDGGLKLKDLIIIPYQNKNINEYRNLLK